MSTSLADRAAPQGEPPARSSSARYGSSRSNGLVAAGALAAGLAAVAAPATFTGSPVIDAVERAALAAAVTYVGAHGRRVSWLVAGAVAAVAARGLALALVLAGLAVAAQDGRNRRRSRPTGALVSALLVNAVLWYPADGSPILVPLLATAALVVLVISGRRQLRRGPRRTFAVVVLAVLVLAGVAAALAGYAVLGARGDVEAGTRSARSALAAVERGDTAAAETALADALDHLERAQDGLGASLLPARAVPGLAQQARAVRVAVDEGIAVAQAARDLVTIDYDQLRYDGRVDLDAVDELAPRSARVHDVLVRAAERLEDVRGDRLVPPLRDRIDELTEEVVGARDDADLADRLVRAVPGLLGNDGERTYLVVFVTPAELRGAGGFIGNWAELRATDGDVDLTRSGRIEELIDAAEPGTRTLDGPEDYLRRFGRFQPQDYLQDATFSPDWPSDADVLAQLYPQSGGTEVDGVISVDPTGLAALLELTGPVSVDGVAEPLSAENAVEFLTRTQYLAYGDRAGRAEILEAATRATFTALTEGSLPAPRDIGAALGPAARGRHLQVWSPDREEEALFTRLDADGRVEVPVGEDGFALAQQNSGNNKIDAYLQRDVVYDADVDAATGELTATMRITLHNDLPGDPATFPRSVAANRLGAPDGTNLSFLAVYTPHLVTKATIDGAEVELAHDEELGLNTWETPLLGIPAGGEVVIELELEGRVDLADGYRFRYLPQPMANPDRLQAAVTARNGSFVRDGDRVVRIGLDEAAEEELRLDAGMRR